MDNKELGKDKAPGILKIMDELSRDVGGPGIVQAATTGACAWCGKHPIGDFTDELSRKEYRISGCCQVCQDKMFAEEDP